MAQGATAEAERLNRRQRIGRRKFPLFFVRLENESLEFRLGDGG